MNSFISRAARLCVWTTLGAFGCALLIFGVLKLLAPFKMRVKIQEVSAPLGGTGAEKQLTDIMAKLSTPMMAAMFVLGLITIVFGAVILRFCWKRIKAALKMPIPSGEDIRSEAPIGRLMAVFIFTSGIGLGIYTAYDQSDLLVRDTTEYLYHHDAQARIVGIDPAPQDGRERTATLVYDTVHGQVTYIGMLPPRMQKYGKVGDTFFIHYHEHNPQTPFYEFRTRKLSELMSYLFTYLIILWLITAGIAGLVANLPPDGDQSMPNDGSPQNGNVSDSGPHMVRAGYQATGFGRRHLP